MKTKELIKDKRLTPTMERIRSGTTQLFREKNKNDRTFINRENSDVILDHENKEMYAELIDDKWYWVSGCYECNGKERDTVMSYIECETHDVCRKCSKSRKEFEDAVWGGVNGWTCKPCKEAKDLEVRIEAFEKFNHEDYSKYHFMFNDDIICPHCGSKIGNDDIHESQDLDCYVCEGEISLEVEYTATYSTSIKGKRITE